MMLADGCSGSTFIFAQLKELLERHGVNVWSPTKEFICSEDGYNNFLNEKPYCTELDGTEHFWPVEPTERLEAAWSVLSGSLTCAEHDDKRDSTIFFFDGHKRAPMLEVLPFLESLGSEHSKLVGLHREHRLEHMICSVKDCFRSDQLNYPVNKDGQKSDMCFERRKENATDDEYKVILDPRGLLDNLIHLHPVWTDADMVARLDNDVFRDFAYASYESLTDYEYAYSERALDHGADIYAALLESIGVKPDWMIIRQYLAQNGLGSRTPHQVTDEIYNIGDVQAVLDGTAYNEELMVLARRD